jgi:phosphonate transport system substrate-binding protein
VTGKRVQFFPVQGNAAQIEAMRAGRLHVAGFNPGSTPLAVNCAGFVPFAVMASNDGRFGYEMELITHPGSGIASVADIRGRKLAFTSETSNSGFKAASLLLREKFGMKAGTDYQPVFSGKHDNSILGVVNKHYPAAAVANFVRFNMERRGIVKPGQTVVLYSSETFPTIAYGHAHNLSPDLAQKIRQAFFSFAWKGSALAAEFNRSDPPQEKFLPVSYRTTWRIVRDIDQAMGIRYDCR